MSDLQTSPEQVAAANAFNARREQDARDWNNQVRGHGNGLTPSASPIVSMPDGSAGLNNEALREAADSWKAPEAEEITTPSNVTDIASHPNFHRVESEGEAQPEGAQSVETVMTPEATRDFAAEQDAVFKALEINGRLSSDSSSILELSDAVRALNPDSATYQQLNSRMLDRLISNELHITDAERAGELLNLSLKMLEHPDNSPEIVSRLDNTILTIFSHDAAKFDLAQLQHFSSIAKDRHRDDERFFKAFDAQAAKLVNEGMVPSPAGSVSSEQPVVEVSQPSESVAAAAPQVAPAAKPITPLRTAYDIAAEKTGGPIKTAEDADAPAEPEVEADEPAADAEAAEKQKHYEAIGEANRRIEKLIGEVKGNWDATPDASRKALIGYHFRRLNELSGDVAAYARELENDMKAGKGKYDNLKGDELDKIVMRKQAVVKEFEQISNEVERARLNSPEAVQGAAEYAKLQEKARKSSEKLNARTAELRDRYPAFAPLMDNDVHIKVEPKRIHQPKKRPSVWDKLKGQA